MTNKIITTAFTLFAFACGIYVGLTSKEKLPSLPKAMIFAGDASAMNFSNPCLHESEKLIPHMTNGVIDYITFKRSDGREIIIK